MLAILDRSTVKSTSDHLIANTRQVLDTAAADENHGVLLEVVPDPWDISCNFDVVYKTDTADLAKR